VSDVFISYARGDVEHARRLAGVLTLHGWSVWWDRDIPPGASFDDTIDRALAAARCVIVLWSPESISSRWVRAEASEGLARNILVPVLLERVVPPLEFRRIVAADLSDWKTGAAHPELDALIHSVARVLGDREAAAVQSSEALNPVTAPGAGRAPRRAVVIAGLLAIAAVAGVLAYTAWSSDGDGRRAPTEEQQVAPARSIAPNGDRPRIDLLAQSNGGRLVEAPDASWSIPLDDSSPGGFIGVGGDQINLEAIYAFKDRHSASFDTFEILVPGMAENVRDFELLRSNDLAPESFHLIGRFHVRNVLVVDSRYQAFTFPAVTARYLKFRLISSYHGGYTLLTRFRLLGRLEAQ
jgi:hypothetical protein